MTNAVMEKRLASLESEMRSLKSVVRQYVIATPTKKGTRRVKKLPAWLRASLKKVEEGKLAGPFHSVEELMADLRKP